MGMTEAERILDKIDEAKKSVYDEIKSSTLQDLWSYLHDFIIAVGNKKATDIGVDVKLVDKIGETENDYEDEKERKQLIEMAYSVHDYEDNSYSWYNRNKF